MKILGIDPGYAVCGWALLDRERGGSVTIDRTGAIRSQKSLPAERRLDDVCARLRGVMEREAYSADGLGMVAIEGYEYQGERSSGRAAMLLPQMIGRLQEMTRGLGVQCVTLHRSSVIWSLTRSRKSDKSKVARAVLAFTGYRPKSPISEHEADAAAVAIIGSMMRD